MYDESDDSAVKMKILDLLCHMMDKQSASSFDEDPEEGIADALDVMDKAPKVGMVEVTAVKPAQKLSMGGDVDKGAVSSTVDKDSVASVLEQLAGQQDENLEDHDPFPNMRKKLKK